MEISPEVQAKIEMITKLPKAARFGIIAGLGVVLAIGYFFRTARLSQQSGVQNRVGRAHRGLAKGLLVRTQGAAGIARSGLPFDGLDGRSLGSRSLDGLLSLRLFLNRITSGAAACQEQDQEWDR